MSKSNDTIYTSLTAQDIWCSSQSYNHDKVCVVKATQVVPTGDIVYLLRVNPKSSVSLGEQLILRENGDVIRYIKDKKITATLIE